MEPEYEMVKDSTTTEGSTRQPTTPAFPPEAQFWPIVDTLCDTMDASGFIQVVLGLIYLDFVSHAIEELHPQSGPSKCEQEGSGGRMSAESRVFGRTVAQGGPPVD